MEEQEEEAGLRSGRGTQSPLACYPVWHRSDLPWQAERAFTDPACVFSLVQSTTQEPARSVLRAVDQYMNAKNIYISCT